MEEAVGHYFVSLQWPVSDECSWFTSLQHHFWRYYPIPIKLDSLPTLHMPYSYFSVKLNVELGQDQLMNQLEAVAAAEHA